MKKLPVVWAKHLPKDEQEEFFEYVRHNHRLLSRLRQIIDDKISVIERAEANEETYRDAGYAYWQAHQNGREAALKDLRKLTDFLED